MKLKLYLAGPMTGYALLNFPAFHSEAARLRALGYQVINPAEINDEDPSAVWASEAEKLAHWRRCMRTDIALLVTCDSVALLDGWTSSRGARLEHHIALELGMQPRLAAFFVDQLPPADVCTRCAGAHRLSQCTWPPTPPAAATHAEGEAHV